MISVFGSKVGEEELAEVKDCFDRQWLGTGPKTKAFEEEFSKRQGLPGLALVNSGSNALYAAMTLLRLPRILKSSFRPSPGFPAHTQ